MDTKTKYLGLDIESPIIAGSCGLTNSIADLEKLEAAGAGAIVLKSIFEEQIIYDIKRNLSMMAPTDNYGMSYEYVASHVADDSLSKHFELIKEAKKRLHIPIVGSINCFSFENWMTYTQRFQDAGCDALELNMAILPYETSLSCDDVERLFSNVINTLRKAVSIPISVKVSKNFTDMANFMQRLSWMGIDGITMFNKALNVDIDVEKMELCHAPSLSTPDEIYETMRWVAILSKKLRCSISASTGVHTATDVVKMLLAGAGTVQVVSCLYKNGVDYMRQLNDGLRDWMKKHNYEHLDQFRGKLAVKPNEEASLFFRTQFMKHFAQI
ncbi:MAG: dihydroorotate dehydrogenase-like protein [Bacteroidales bacterium]|nr:dihydroorotate dehydrogenase-like protein [Bacteroidales bacterium]MBR0539330.1 dihydroorotate dehydrogenase-like protein [Bacteroidales bacterium]